MSPRREGFPSAAQRRAAKGRSSASAETLTSIRSSSRRSGKAARSSATGARKISCFCPESARMIAKGALGGESITARKSAICAFVAAIGRPSDDNIQEYIRGCMPRALVRFRVSPSIIKISSGPAPSESAQPSQTKDEPGKATMSRFVKVSFTKSST